MCPAPSADRRKHLRHPLPAAVQLHHAASRRDFPARGVDISFGGMLMYVPAATPLRPGDALRVTLESVNRPEFQPLCDQPIDASVIRINRTALLKAGHLAVGVKFLEQVQAWPESQ